MVKRGGVELASLTMQDIPAIKLKATTDLANVMSGDVKPDSKAPNAPAEKKDGDKSGAAEGDGKAEAPGSDEQGSKEGCAAAPGEPGAVGSILFALLLAVGVSFASRRR